MFMFDNNFVDQNSHFDVGYCTLIKLYLVMCGIAIKSKLIEFLYYTLNEQIVISNLR